MPEQAQPMPISAAEYAERRASFMQKMGDNAIAILPSAQETVRSRDTHYPFRQDSDFAYLTGFHEPESIAVFISKRGQGQFLIFCRDRNPIREIWDGFRHGPEGAVKQFAADNAYSITDIDDILPGIIQGTLNADSKLYFSMTKAPELGERINQWLHDIQSAESSLHSSDFIEPDHIISEMRLFKSATELALMQKSADISSEAHIAAMGLCQPALYEYQLQAIIEYVFAHNGASAPAYGTIVGSGSNACTLHYIENNQQMQSGGLVLIDAGSEYQGYAADITRTFPVNGRFSKEQQAIYNIVLEANEAAIEACQPGNSYDLPYQVSVKIITQGLLALGILTGELDELIQQQAYKPYYLHRVGHWLGLDVHDVGLYKNGGPKGQWRELEAGMVTTIEPGIYIQSNNTSVHKRWRGIGVRIEDNIAITKNGYINMSQQAPKTCKDIEALMSSHKKPKAGADLNQHREQKS